MAFQSRFGRAKWLEPATDKVLAELPAAGVRSVAVVAPGFSADCLETLEEMAIRGRETFEAAGGERFAYLPYYFATPGSGPKAPGFKGCVGSSYHIRKLIFAGSANRGNQLAINGRVGGEGFTFSGQPTAAGTQSRILFFYT